MTIIHAPRLPSLWMRSGASSFAPALLVALLLLLIIPLLPSPSFTTACSTRSGRMVRGKLGRRRNCAAPLIRIPPLAASRALLHSFVNTPRIVLSGYRSVCPVVLDLAAKHIR
ncbi:hypothetical protein K438DRAFT_1807280 [Mycena galopus ATCC 62051]|nr:hypothetical protein K438DRAFT_1807280 [Mycena galopus ATCC 62051]